MFGAVTCYREGTEGGNFEGFQRRKPVDTSLKLVEGSDFRKHQDHFQYVGIWGLG